MLTILTASVLARGAPKIRVQVPRERRLSGNAPCVESLSDPSSFIDVVYRDFNSNHPDFWTGQWDWWATTGLVQDTLDLSTITADDPHPRPTCNSPRGNGSTLMLPNCDRFAQWYRDVPGVNSRYDTQLELDYDPQTGVSTFYSSEYFPMDGRGFNELTDAGEGDGPRNYLFSSEYHMEVRSPAASLAFRGLPWPRVLPHL